MREHMGLYRGKRLDNGEWVEGYLYITNEGIHAIQVYEAATNIDRYTYIVDPDTVGECAGLPDKNGKLIFEGDILRIIDEPSGYDGDGFGIIHFGRFKDTDALSDFDHLGWYLTVSTIPDEATTIFALEENSITYEVIGNIHDNPELLQQEK